MIVDIKYMNFILKISENSPDLSAKMELYHSTMKSLKGHGDFQKKAVRKSLYWIV